MIHSKIMEIDAGIAADFLKKEKPPQAGTKGTNRKFSMNLVREYADAMLRDEWVDTHQGIAFNEDGDMVDGGHRMRALIVADAERPGITVRFMVTTGLPSEAMLAMDIGKRRVPADFLAMSGESNTTALGGIIRLAYCYQNVPWVHNETWSRYRITPLMMREYLDNNPLLRDSVYETFPLKKLFKASAAGAFWFLARQAHPGSQVQEFLEQLRSGEMLTKGDPALTLRELMLNTKARGDSYTAAEELALLIKAYNKWFKGQGSVLLAFRSSENFPRIAE